MGRGGGRNGRAVSELESEFGASTRGSRVGRLDFIGPSRPKRNLIKEYLRTAKVSHGKGKDVAIFPDLTLPSFPICLYTSAICFIKALPRTTLGLC
jgi:hypothetical protein